MSASAEPVELPANNALEPVNAITPEGQDAPSAGTTSEQKSNKLSVAAIKPTDDLYQVTGWLKYKYCPDENILRRRKTETRYFWFYGGEIEEDPKKSWSWVQPPFRARQTKSGIGFLFSADCLRGQMYPQHGINLADFQGVDVVQINALRFSLGPSHFFKAITAERCTRWVKALQVAIEEANRINKTDDDSIRRHLSQTISPDLPENAVQQRENLLIRVAENYTQRCLVAEEEIPNCKRRLQEHLKEAVDAREQAVATFFRFRKNDFTPAPDLPQLDRKSLLQSAFSSTNDAPFSESISMFLLGIEAARDENIQNQVQALRAAHDLAWESYSQLTHAERTDVRLRQEKRELEARLSVLPRGDFDETMTSRDRATSSKLYGSVRSTLRSLSGTLRRTTDNDRVTRAGPEYQHQSSDGADLEERFNQTEPRVTSDDPGIAGHPAVRNASTAGPPLPATSATAPRNDSAISNPQAEDLSPNTSGTQSAVKTAKTLASTSTVHVDPKILPRQSAHLVDSEPAERSDPLSLRSNPVLSGIRTATGDRGTEPNATAQGGATYVENRPLSAIADQKADETSASMKQRASTKAFWRPMKRE